MTPIPGARGRRQARLADDIRERRLEELRATVEEFLYQFGLLVAGHDPEFERCASRAVAAQLRATLQPFLASGDVLRPDFGPHGELRVEGDLVDPDMPVTASVEFEDRSMRQPPAGRPVAAPRRRVRMSLHLSVQPCRVTACAVRMLETA